MKKLLVLLLLIYPLSAVAVTYEWTDAAGTVNFTEDLGKVPKKYRKKAKVLGAEESGTPQVIESSEPAPAKTRDTGKGKDAGAQKEKKLYGGKDEQAWKSEIGAAKSDLQAAERDLASLRERLNDTSKMSRTEYLSIQTSLKHGEVRVQELKKRLDGLRQSADKLEVPLESK